MRSSLAGGLVEARPACSFGSRSGLSATQTGEVQPKPSTIGLPLMPITRARPLVLVATPDTDFGERLVRDVRGAGSVACLARSAEGCLRVATSVGPDVVLLDARLPDRLRGMLRSHPATAGSAIVRVSDGETTWSECVAVPRPASRPARLSTQPTH